MNSTKTSINRTGVTFYTPLPQTSAYRVRFKSFNMAIQSNQQRLGEVQSMQGKCAPRQRTQSSVGAARMKENEKYKTNKDRLKENDELRNRLKSMKCQRRVLLEKIKYNKV